MKRAPWVLTEEEARARDIALVLEFHNAVRQSQRIVDPERRKAWLTQQFGGPTVLKALEAAVERLERSLGIQQEAQS